MNNDQHGEVKKKIANLGQQGWELVAIQQASNSLEFNFKKPAGER
ncbi:MAG: hypothetical protein QOF01_424 [Thermomicrobiales bacterium]|nr:hypothetical protein [Thermomicrobiales bacterium]